MLSSIPKGNLGLFRFPPVYPAMGYLSSLVCPFDPFLVVDFVLFIGFIWLSWRSLRVFLPEVVALMAAGTLVHVAVVLFEQPWTSSVSATGLALLAYANLVEKYTWRWGLASGIVLGLIFGARTQDTVAAALVFSLALFPPVWRTSRDFWRWSIAVMLPIGLIVTIVLWTNYHFTHHILGTYFQTNMSQGFDPSAAPRKLYGYFLDSWRFDHELQRPVFQVVPLVLLAPIGLACLAASRGTRRVAMVFSASMAGWFSVYSSFYAVGAATLRYGSIHYVTMLFPAFLGCGAYALTAVVRGVGAPSLHGGEADDSIVRG